MPYRGSQCWLRPGLLLAGLNSQASPPFLWAARILYATLGETLLFGGDPTAYGTAQVQAECL
jgi:hypothetical protein